MGGCRALVTRDARAPRRRPVVEALLAVSLALLCTIGDLPSARSEDPPLTAVVSNFKKLLRSKDPKGQARAFEVLRQAKDPSVVDHITWGVRTLEAAVGKVRKDQEKLEKEYEKLFTDLTDAQQEFDASPGSSKDMERYNQRAKKISKRMDDAVLELKNLENDATRLRAHLTQAVLVAGELLGVLEGEAFADALARLTTQWLHGKEIDDRLRWFSAVQEVDKPLVSEALHGVAGDASFETTLRVRAIDVLAARRDGRMLGEAIELLKLPIDQEPLLQAAARALRTMHDSRGIEPLIAFLGREDLKKERDVAQQALVSLTGVDQGPFGATWKKWWDDNQKTFTMPKDPKPAGTVKAPEKGKTFYGIHTFSDKILFVVDISGSMDKQQKSDGAAGKTKFEILQQELTGTVYNLNPTDTFNVVFFNHQVIPWQARKVEASDRNKDLLKAWVMDQKPLGGTNIYDALELGFQIAHRVTGASNLDTIFFLTDGKPTAGKIRDPERILELLKAWNESAHLTIHCIGIGDDHDEDFLRRLAQLGDGTYLRR